MVMTLCKQGSINVIKNALRKWLSIQVANKVTGFLEGQLMGFLTFSVEGIIGLIADYASDRKVDGIITLWK